MHTFPSRIKSFWVPGIDLSSENIAVDSVPLNQQTPRIGDDNYPASPQIGKNIYFSPN